MENDGNIGQAFQNFESNPTFSTLSLHVSVEWILKNYEIGRKNPGHMSSGRDFKLGVPSLRFQAR